MLNTIYCRLTASTQITIDDWFFTTSERSEFVTSADCFEAGGGAGAGLAPAQTGGEAAPGAGGAISSDMRD